MLYDSVHIIMHDKNLLSCLIFDTDKMTDVCYYNISHIHSYKFFLYKRKQLLQPGVFSFFNTSHTVLVLLVLLLVLSLIVLVLVGSLKQKKKSEEI